MNDNRILGLPEPLTDTEPATKYYADHLPGATYTGSGAIDITTNVVSLVLDGSTLAQSASGLKIPNGAIGNDQVGASAAIAESKLNLNNPTHPNTWSGLDKTGSNLTDIVTRSHTSLTDIGTNTHAQIDSHIGSTSNPHSVTAAQAGAVALTGNETIAGSKTFSSAIQAAYKSSDGSSGYTGNQTIYDGHATHVFAFKDGILVSVT